MNKKRYFTVENVLIFGMVVFIIMAGISTALYKQQEKENRQLVEGLGDFMMYMVNVTDYCAELNNMTYNELLKSYLQVEANRIVAESFANSGGSD